MTSKRRRASSMRLPPTPNEIGPRVSKAIVDHVHVQIAERNLAGGWDDVSGAEAVLPVP